MFDSGFYFEFGLYSFLIWVRILSLVLVLELASDLDLISVLGLYSGLSFDLYVVV